ncbi:MAG: class I tRNA ligase family protein, partial [Pseudomonadota bacterium]
TKLWNAARFLQMNECAVPADFDPETVTQALSQWILHEASQAEVAITEALDSYRFHDAASAIYQFTWNIYCDWFLEFAKPTFQGEDEAAKAEIRATASYVFDRILVLLHPFMPFVTEELWAHMGDREDFVMRAEWTAPQITKKTAAGDLQFVIRLISEIRSVRTEMNVPPSARLPLVALEAGEGTTSRLSAFASLIEKVARIDHISHADAPPKGAAQIVVEGETYALPIADFIDLEAEVARLEKSMAKTQGEIDKIDKQLGNAKFVERAPEAVVAEKKEQKEGFATTLSELRAALDRLKSL